MIAARITLNHRNFVIVPEADWSKVAPAGGMAIESRKKTARQRGHDAPVPLPKADARGNRPALAFADAAIARGIVERRKHLGLSQIDLARLAGIRAEVLNRAERAVTIPTLRTLAKIEDVLGHLERRAKQRRRRNGAMTALRLGR